MTWMARFLATRDDIDYTGIDIVPELIALNQKTFASRPWKFLNWDVIRDGLPGKYDLVISRLTLHHFLNRDVIAFLMSVSRSGSTALMVSSYAQRMSNGEVRIESKSRYRLLNLEAPPISLAPPICFFRDGPSVHSMSLYMLPLLQVADCVAATKMKPADSSDKLVYYSCGAWSV
jgi:Methyltransferase domain